MACPATRRAGFRRRWRRDQLSRLSHDQSELHQRRRTTSRRRHARARQCGAAARQQRDRAHRSEPRLSFADQIRHRDDVGERRAHRSGDAPSIDAPARRVAVPSAARVRERRRTAARSRRHAPAGDRDSCCDRRESAAARRAAARRVRVARGCRRCARRSDRGAAGEQSSCSRRPARVAATSTVRWASSRAARRRSRDRILSRRVRHDDVAFGLVPAFRASRVDLNRDLREGGAGAGSSQQERTCAGAGSSP